MNARMAIFNDRSPNQGEPMMALATPPLQPQAGMAESIGTLEALIKNLEAGVGLLGHATLFVGETPRLDIQLQRKEGDGPLRWGVKSHEDWAFKATLLRFARGTEPVHLLVDSGRDGAEGIRVWVVRRGMETFWASPLSSGQAHDFRGQHMSAAAIR